VSILFKSKKSVDQSFICLPAKSLMIYAAKTIESKNILIIVSQADR